MARKSLTSPRGIAVYPWLNKADMKFAKGPNDGVFKTGLLLAADHPFLETIGEWVDAAYDSACKKAKNKKERDKIQKVNPYRAEEDEEGDETDQVIVNFKCLETGTDTKTGKTYTRRVRLFDAGLKPTSALVGGGSEIKVSFNTAEYWMKHKKDEPSDAGITLYMNAVQILQLVGLGGDGASYGFEEDEDGWEDDGSHTVTADADTESDDDDDGEAKFDEQHATGGVDF